MFYKIKSVKPVENYILLVQFENGEVKKYNIAALFDKLEVFKSLTYIKGLFDMVQVDAGGYGIYWNSEMDLSCNELYYNGIAV
jgi:hypothetical protein